MTTPTTLLPTTPDSKNCIRQSMLWLLMLHMILLPAFGQEEAADLPGFLTKPIELHPEALGTLSFPISIKNEEVQAYFDQGVQLKYAFGVRDAARSFREAWKRDSTCAICYWGEAWALGSYLNEPLSEEHAPHALAAIRKATQLAQTNASPMEQALIKAMTVRYVEDFDPEKRAIQDTAYAMAMKEVYEDFPQNLDVATIYAEALFLLEPRRGTRDLDDPDVMRIHEVLEKILVEDITHPGACHLYIHATESTPSPEKAASCAKLIGSSIPGASHINHMPSHTWNEMGLWGEAVRANLQAWHSDQKAKIGEGFAIYPAHNLHMLLYAASMDGQGAIAIQAGKDFHKTTNNPIFHLLTLIRFGRFDEVLELTERPQAAYPRAVWDFCQGYARLRMGEADLAEVYVNRVFATADTITAKVRHHEAKTLLYVLGGILKGEILREMGDLKTAIVAFEGAVDKEDEMAWDEPEPLPFAARHWLGAALLEAGKYAEAEQCYREDVADHPHNGWSLFGLQKALEAQGKRSLSVDMDWEKSWERADVWLKASRF